MALEEREGKRYTCMCTNPCASQWFARFAQGCKEQMGQDVRSNKSLSLLVMHQLLFQCSKNARTAKNIDDCHLWVMCGGFYATCYVAALRGPEG